MDEDARPDESVLFADAWQDYGHSSLLPDDSRPAAVGAPVVSPRPEPLDIDRVAAAVFAPPPSADRRPPAAPVLAPTLQVAPLALPPLEQPAGPAMAWERQRRRRTNHLWGKAVLAAAAAVLALAHPLTAGMVLWAGAGMARNKGASPSERVVGLVAVGIALVGLVLWFNRR